MNEHEIAVRDELTGDLIWAIPRRYYVIRFVDGGFDTVSAGPFSTRSAADKKAKKLRPGWRGYNRENPRHQVSFHVESNRSMPFDPAEVR